MDEIQKDGRRFSIWLEGERGFRCSPQHARNMGYQKNWVVRWHGTGFLLEASSPTAEMRFLFETSEHAVQGERVYEPPFWETMVGLRHPAMPLSVVTDEDLLVDALGEEIKKLWDTVRLAAPVPGLTIRPFEVTHLIERKIISIIRAAPVPLRTV